MRAYGLELTEPERQCIAHICQIGFMSTLEIQRTADGSAPDTLRVRRPGQTRAGGKLKAASFVDLVSMIESLGF
jgi:hypothetical protein